MIKKLFSVIMVVVTLLTMSSTSLAYSRQINTPSNITVELGYLYMPAGSYNCKLSTSGLNCSSGTPQLKMNMYTSGFVIHSKTFYGNGYSTKRYSLAGGTNVYVSADNLSSGQISGTVG